MKNVLCVIVVLMAGLSVSYSQMYSENFTIASGSMGGNYYKYGKYISGQYNNNDKYKFISYETNGSIDNIEQLKSNMADFAIIQRNVLIDKVYDEENGIQNIEIIAPLFEEKLLMYYHSDSIFSLSDLRNLGKPIRIGFTSRQGYSYKLFQIIINLIEVSESSFEFEFSDYSSLTTKYKNFDLDMLVSFSLPIQQIENIECSQKIYLKESTIALIEPRLSNLYKTKLFDGTQEYFTFGSWTFLVGLSNQIEKIENQNFLLENLLLNPIDRKDIALSNDLNLSHSKFLKNDDNEISLLTAIPVHKVFKRKLLFKRINWSLYLIIFFLILLFVIIVYFVKGTILKPSDIIYFFKKKILFIYHRYKHLYLGIILIIALYFVSFELLIFSENEFYSNIGKKSQLLNFSRTNLHKWLFIANITGNDNGVFPYSTIGKMMVLVNFLLFWFATILLTVSEYLIYLMNKKRKNGLMGVNYENHIVIFGWNDNTEEFIKDLINNARFNNVKLNIVCVINDVVSISSKFNDFRKLKDTYEIDVIRGDARNNDSLLKANVHKAETIVLLSEGNSKVDDERILLRALSISRFTKKNVEKPKQKKTEKTDYDMYKTENMDAAYIIAEINNIEFREDLIEADVNEIVVSGNYGKGILKQSIFNHGVSKVFDEVLQYNNFNEFYKIDLALDENKHLVGKLYDELLGALRKQGILLIGIHIIFHDEDSDSIIFDQKIIRDLLIKESKALNLNINLEREVIINPTEEHELNRKTDNDDHLIVFALNKKTLEKQVKKVTF